MPRADLDFNAKDKTGGVFRAIFNKLKNLTAKIFTMRAAMSAFGVFMAGRFANQLLKSNDVIGKISDSIGVTTEFLQKLRFANEQSGISIQETDRALQKFSRAIGDARSGTGSLVSLFKDTDPQFLKMLQNTKNNTEAFRVFVNELGQYKNIQDQTTISSAAFGRVGAKMLVMIKDGTFKFDKFSKEADKLGIILKDKVVRNSEETNDALNRMNKVLKNVFANALDKASGSIQKFTNFIIRNRDAIEGFLNKIILGAAKLKNVLVGVGQVADAVGVKVLIMAGRFDKLSKDSLPRVRVELQNALEKLQRMRNDRALIGPFQVDFDNQNKLIENLKKTITRLEAEQLAHSERQILAKGITGLALQKIQDEQDNFALNKKKVLHSREVSLEQKRINDILIARLQGIELASGTEFERLALALDRRIAIIEQSEERGLINNIKAKDLKLKLEEQFQDKLTELARRGALKRRDLDKVTNIQRFQNTVSIFNKILGAGAQHSRALFNISKVAAISDTIISTRTGAMKAYKEWGWPLGAIFAGLIVAAGAANIAAIKSQTFGGGGSVSGAGSAGAGGIQSPADIGATQAIPTGPRQIIIALPDDTEVVSKAWIRNTFIPALNEELEDGSELVA